MNILTRMTAVFAASDKTPFAELVAKSGLAKSDFKFVNLENVDFGTMDVTGYDFTGSNLDYADLSRVVNFNRAMVNECSLKGTSLPNSTKVAVHPGHSLSNEYWKKGEDEFGYWAEFTIKGVSQRLRWIESGEFLMGSPKNEKGRFENEVQHPVRITKGYWLFDTQVTKGLWGSIVEDGPNELKKGDFPVVSVSWDDSAEFLKKLNKEKMGMTFRLPTEAEWEYAGRAGTTTQRFNDNIDDIAWHRRNTDEIESVAMKLPNQWGLFDMLGNVWEWCLDWYGEYDLSVVEDPIGSESGHCRVLRGGGWISNAESLRSAYRFRNAPGISLVGTGFRLAGGLTPGKAKAEP